MSSKRPLRLLVGTDTWPPQVNGVSVVTAATVEGLVQRGWECEVIAPRYPAGIVDPFPRRAPPTPCTTLPSLPCPGYPDVRLAWPLSWQVARTVDRFAPDLVHCATEFVVGSVLRRAARRRGIPYTTSYHTDFARYAEAYGLGWLRPAVQRHIARFHREARCTFTPSEAARHDLAALGVSAVQTWGRAVDVTLFHRRQHSAVLRSTYATPDSCIFLHVGRLAPEKGVERIVTAYHRARQQLPPGAMHLVIAGSGPSEPAVRALGTEGITFLATLDRRDVLPRLYASADVFLFASLTETLGLVVLEAMASGLPVVATPAGGVAEHLVDGANGLAYPPDNVEALVERMVRLARDPALRHRLAVGARATAVRLSWDAELDGLDRYYRRLIGDAATA